MAIDPAFPTHATHPTARFSAGNVDGQPFDDLVLTGTQQATVPVAFRTGANTFTVKDHAIDPLFVKRALTNGIHTADLNGDGRTDLALTGGQGWTTVPVAFATGGNAFAVTDEPIP